MWPTGWIERLVTRPRTNIVTGARGFFASIYRASINPSVRQQRQQWCWLLQRHYSGGAVLHPSVLTSKHVLSTPITVTSSFSISYTQLKYMFVRHFAYEEEEPRWAKKLQFSWLLIAAWAQSLVSSSGRGRFQIHAQRQQQLVTPGPTFVAAAYQQTLAAGDTPQYAALRCRLGENVETQSVLCIGARGATSDPCQIQINNATATSFLTVCR